MELTFMKYVRVDFTKDRHSHRHRGKIHSQSLYSIFQSLLLIKCAFSVQNMYEIQNFESTINSFPSCQLSLSFFGDLLLPANIQRPYQLTKHYDLHTVNRYFILSNWFDKRFINKCAINLQIHNATTSTTNLSLL